MGALHKAIRAAGTQAALARACGQFPQVITRWKKKGLIPLGHCASVEAATGIPCEELRPDVDWERDASGRVVGYRVRLGRCGTRADGEG